MVTGGTGGIGRWAALGLAEAGYQVILVGRDPERLRSASDWIGGRVPNRVPLSIEADLSLLAQTRRAAAEVLELTPVLDILLNNAGTLSSRRADTAEGHETTLAVNHLAPFVLTRALLPALQRSGHGRVVMTGSSTSDRARIDPDDLELRRRWRMTRAYGRSKLASLMTSIELAGEAAGSGVTINVVHPGLVATGLVRTGGIVQLAWRAMAPFALTEAQGAEPLLDAALSPGLAGVSGCYLKRCAVVAPNPLADDPGLRRRVLRATAHLVGQA
ncbi:SDR family NAD(P)-dependent oxidoreductase [Lichenicola sp.]|uniref:SDR family NAD(P)-dependent oxidoreductase n=1 Tax=Lichenicola sp. TaxID=2804529 RepID=UPI003B0050E0